MIYRAIAIVALSCGITSAADIDLSAFDGPPACASPHIDLSAFEAAPTISLDAFEARPTVDLSAFDTDQRPAVKPSPAALDYPKRSSNWTHPGSDKNGLIQHLMTHPNHGGKFAHEMLMGLDYRELESLHSDDHEGHAKPVQVAAIKYSTPPAAVNCPNGRCPVSVPSTLTTTAQGMTPTRQTPQPVYYYQQGCPGGVCPTPQRRGLFGLIRSNR